MKKEIQVMIKMSATLFTLAIVLAWTFVPGPTGSLASENAPQEISKTEQEAPDLVEIDAITSATTRYLPIQFTHRVHVEEYEIECKACHELKPSGDLRVYYHRLCVGCHAAKEGISAAPPDCFSCHVERQ